jgi:WD40 repeat protein
MKPPADYTKPEELKELNEVARYPAHDSTKPGIHDLDIHPIHQNLIISGGKDSKAVLLDHSSGSVVKKFDPLESKKKQVGVTVARFVPGMSDVYGIFGGSDGSASLWSLDYANDSYKQKYAIKNHTGAITDVSFQPLNEYVAVASKDKTWSFHNLIQGVKLGTFQEE